MLDTGHIFTAKSDGKYQLHSKTQEENTPAPSILQSEDSESQNFLAPDTLSDKEEDSPEIWTVKNQAQILRKTYTSIRDTLHKLKQLPHTRSNPWCKT